MQSVREDLSKQCNCGSKDKFLREKGHQTGLYCASCSNWFKWVGKKLIPDFNRLGYRVHNESWIPDSVRSPRGSHIPPHPLQSQQPQGIFPPEDTASTFADEAHHLPEEEAYLSTQPEQESLYRNPAHPVPVSEPCNTCLTNVLESLSKDDRVSFTIYEGVLTAITKQNRQIVGSAKFNFCPTCGRSLKAVR